MLSRLLAASNAMLVMILRVVEPTVEKTLFFTVLKMVSFLRVSKRSQPLLVSRITK